MKDPKQLVHELRNLENDIRDETTIELAATCIEQMIAAVKKHHSQTKDDLCWMDDNDLYAAFGLPPKYVGINSEEEQLDMCKRFIKNRCYIGGNWKSYKDLEEENERLKKEIVELEERLDRVYDSIKE